MFFDIHTHAADKSSNCIYNLQKEEGFEGWFSAGIHPRFAEHSNEQSEWLNKVTKSQKCLAIGEVGLDKLKGPAMDIQLAIFRRQIELSERLELPLIIHCARAWNELRSVKRELKPKQIWIYHGFAKALIAKEVLDEGMIISIGAAVLSNHKLQQAVINIPTNRLFLETDDSSTPVCRIYEKVSELKNIPLHDLEKEIETTVKSTFKRWTTG
ncbi:MAG: TatD family hydrolase [Flavobacteriia bacterium]|jgi:TatD DNase family protein